LNKKKNLIKNYKKLNLGGLFRMKKLGLALGTLMALGTVAMASGVTPPPTDGHTAIWNVSSSISSVVLQDTMFDDGSYGITNKQNIPVVVTIGTSKDVTMLGDNGFTYKGKLTLKQSVYDVNTKTYTPEQVIFQFYSGSIVPNCGTAAVNWAISGLNGDLNNDLVLNWNNTNYNSSTTCTVDVCNVF